MDKADIELFLGMIGEPPVNEKRAEEIVMEMAEIRTMDTPNDLWMRKCLYDIPKTPAESLYITFILGSTGAKEAIERQAKAN